MDTRLKKFKHSLWVKALCVILSAATMYACVYCAVAAASTLYFYGSLDVLNDKDVKLEETSSFYNVAQQDISAVASLAAYADIDGLDAEITSHKESEVNAALTAYLTKKAAIIEDELYYVATHYDKDEDDSYDEAYYHIVESTTRLDMSTTVPSAPETTAATAGTTEMSTENVAVTTTAAVDKYISLTVDSFAPKNVQVAQSILKKTSGLGFLNYESMVRSDAFTEQSFDYDNYFNLSNGDVFTWNANDYNCMMYDLSQNEALTELSETYDSACESYVTNIEGQKNISQYQLSKCVNFKYIVLDASGTVFMTNVDNTDTAVKNIKSHDCYLIFKDGKCDIVGFDYYEKMTRLSGMADTVTYTVGQRNLTIYAYLDNPLTAGDEYYYQSLYISNNASDNVKKDVLTALVAFAISVMFLVFLLCLCGHKNEVEGYSLAFIDRLPGDVHLVLSIASTVGLVALAWLLAETVFNVGFTGYPYMVQSYASGFEYYDWILAGISALAAGAWVIFIEWFASLTRTIKAHSPYFKKFIVVRLIVWVFRLLKKQFRFIFKLFKKLKAAFSYKPIKFKRVLILAFAAYQLFNILFSAFLLAGNGTSFFGFLMLAALNVFVFYKTLKYFKHLDTIIDAAGREHAVIPDTSAMPESLKSLASSIRLTHDELHAAVEKAVKDERTKTELITNVSHDLKTPLTAVISYVDLLKKCDITDETALGYIGVLDEKSIKLKRLIEDLIEASKVSTGNVALNPVGVNLTELAVQAIGEMNDLFEERSLEIRLSEPEKPPIIFADSQKTFRIIDNLLNNARKYSAQGSRVYVTVSSNDYYGIFEVKNISGEPLNISPEELTERFVRGDQSRSNDGNGLGLSIAKDLCRLQNGKLIISIDGDLFKASVYLPLKDKFSFTSETPAANA